MLKHVLGIAPFKIKIHVCLWADTYSRTTRADRVSEVRVRCGRILKSHLFFPLKEPDRTALERLLSEKRMVAPGRPSSIVGSDGTNGMDGD